MPPGSPLELQRLLATGTMPAGLRLFLGAASGAVLSLSFTGGYIGVYSWFSVGILIYAIVGTRPLVAFLCGMFHSMAFIFTSERWLATVLTVHGGLTVAGGWGVLLLIALVCGTLVGAFAWLSLIHI